MQRSRLCALWFYAVLIALLPLFTHAGEEGLTTVALDRTHVLVRAPFPLDAKTVSLVLDPAQPLAWKGLEDPRCLLLTLNTPLPENAVLTLTTRVKQVLTATLIPPVWPSDMTALTYRWANEQVPNMRYDPREKSILIDGIRTDGLTRIDDAGRVVLQGGRAIVPETATKAFYAASRKSNEFSLEMTLAPASATDGIGAIAGMGANFRLTQRKDALLFSLRVGKLILAPKKLCTLPADGPVHLVISYRNGLLKVFINGAEAFTDDTCTGNLARWRAVPLQFGDADGEAPWRGSVSGIALYARALGADEAARNAAAGVPVQQAPDAPPAKPRATVLGVITALTETPPPTAVLPYRHALITFEYRVTKITAGTLPDVKDGTIIRVLRWGILNGKKTAVAEAKVGDESTLVLETFGDHPELARQYTVDQLAENLDAPVLLEMSR